MSCRLFLVALSFISCLSIEVKIVDGVDKKGERGPSTGLSYSEPDPFYGPEALVVLNGLCFTATAERYEYSVCPFQNITQRRLIGPSATLLGVWGQWLLNETSRKYDTMLYSNGQTCGRKGRSVRLSLFCGHPNFEILSKAITETSSCEHEIAFGLPIACNLFIQKIYASDSLPPSVEAGPLFEATTSYTKSHSSGPNQYIPADLPASQVIPTISPTTVSKSGSVDSSLLTSLKQQISQLQQTLEILLSNEKSSNPSSRHDEYNHSRL